MESRSRAMLRSDALLDAREPTPRKGGSSFRARLSVVPGKCFADMRSAVGPFHWMVNLLLVQTRMRLSTGEVSIKGHADPTRLLRLGSQHRHYFREEAEPPFRPPYILAQFAFSWPLNRLSIFPSCPSYGCRYLEITYNVTYSSIVLSRLGVDLLKLCRGRNTRQIRYYPTQSSCNCGYLTDIIDSSTP